jgi:hypothetical protein
MLRPCPSFYSQYGLACTLERKALTTLNYGCVLLFTYITAGARRYGSRHVDVFEEMAFASFVEQDPELGEATSIMMPLTSRSTAEQRSRLALPSSLAMVGSWTSTQAACSASARQLPAPPQMGQVMQLNKFDNANIIGMDFATRERQSALAVLHRVRLRPATASSSIWGIDVAGSDRRSVHAWLKGKGDLRTSWWNLYSRVYLVMVPDADLECAMYSFHRMHHTITLSSLGYILGVRMMRRDIQRRGVLVAVKTAVTTDDYSASQ